MAVSGEADESYARTSRQLANLRRLGQKLDAMPAASNADGLSNRDHDRIFPHGMTPIFVDTGAWFARFVPTDRDHPAVRDWFEQNTHQLVTTDEHFQQFGTVTVVP